MDELTRKGLRHALLRRRNERILASHDEAWPLLVRMHSETLSDLLVDDDPAEATTFDFEGARFMGIPVLGDDTMAHGAIALDWPATS